MTAAAIGVAGYGRCGSTLIMTMLHAGGIRPVAGTARGSYELAGGITAMAGIPPELLPGHSVKLLDYHAVTGSLPGAADQRWAFVWMRRDPLQQARSLIKLLNATTDARIHPAKAYQIARDTRETTDRDIARLRATGAEVLELSFEDALHEPARTAAELGDLVERHDLGPFHPDAAAAFVLQRSPACRPDLAVEEFLISHRPPTSEEGRR